MSRWDAAVKDQVPVGMANRLGIAVAQQIHAAYRELLASTRWKRAHDAGAHPQRLLFASTGTKDPRATDVLYVQSLAAPLTINTMPEATLLAFADHGEVGLPMAVYGGDSEVTLAQFARAGIDSHALAAQLQDEGAKAFVNSWHELMNVISSKSMSLRKAS